MKEHPIPFIDEMTRAILDGRKTQTRRIADFVPIHGANLSFSGLEPGYYCTGVPTSGHVLYSRRGDGVWEQRTEPIHCPYGAPGDLLLVEGHPDIVLRITDVRVERVQEISEDDAISEGVMHEKGLDYWPQDKREAHESWIAGGRVGRPPLGPSPRERFAVLWDSINGKKPGRSWADNPWVWAIKFERVVKA